MNERHSLGRWFSCLSLWSFMLWYVLLLNSVHLVMNMFNLLAFDDSLSWWYNLNLDYKFIIFNLNFFRFFFLFFFFCIGADIWYGRKGDGISSWIVQQVGFTYIFFFLLFHLFNKNIWKMRYIEALSLRKVLYVLFNWDIWASHFYLLHRLWTSYLTFVFGLRNHVLTNVLIRGWTVV